MKKLTKEELRSLEGEMEKDIDSSQDQEMEKEKEKEKEAPLSLSLDLESLRWVFSLLPSFLSFLLIS